MPSLVGAVILNIQKGLAQLDATTKHALRNDAGQFPLSKSKRSRRITGVVCKCLLGNSGENNWATTCRRNGQPDVTPTASKAHRVHEQRAPLPAHRLENQRCILVLQGRTNEIRTERSMDMFSFSHRKIEQRFPAVFPSYWLLKKEASIKSGGLVPFFVGTEMATDTASSKTIARRRILQACATRQKFKLRCNSSKEGVNTADIAEMTASGIHRDERKECSTTMHARPNNQRPLRQTLRWWQPSSLWWSECGFSFFANPSGHHQGARNLEPVVACLLPSLLSPNVRSKKKILGRTGIRANSAPVRRTSFYFDGVRTDISDICPNLFRRCRTAADIQKKLSLSLLSFPLLSSHFYLFSFFISFHFYLSSSLSLFISLDLVLSSLFILSSLLFHLLFFSSFSSLLLFSLLLCGVFCVACSVVLCCVAVCCAVLLCVAVCCCVLLCVAVCGAVFAVCVVVVVAR